MTNDPTYDEQLELLARRGLLPPQPRHAVARQRQPVDRFQRAAYSARCCPNPATQREAVAGVMAIMRNVSVPFGAPYGDFWVQHRVPHGVRPDQPGVLFELTTSPNVIWVEMDRLDLTVGGPSLGDRPVRRIARR